MKVLDAALEKGSRWHGLNLYAGGKRLLHVSFDDLDAAHAFLLTLPQSQTERILEARLVALGGEVERGRALASLEQNAERVSARLEDGELIEASWVVGTDGCHSTVRHATGIAFDGSPYEDKFVLADLTLEGDLAQDESYGWFSPEGVLALLPLPGGRARLIAQVEDEKEPTLALFQELIHRRAHGTKLTAKDPVWLAAFKIHHRLASRCRQGRCFLAGDAAHIHSPVGGQGMNTGIQDVYNLTWKLALKEKGGADLLDSYEAERRPVAQGVLRGTDWATRVVTLRHPVAQELRNAIYRVVGQLEVVQQKMLHEASEIGIGYRKSPIVAGSAPFFAKGPSPGDRAPDCEIAPGRRFFLERDGCGHTLLAVGTPPPAIGGVKVIAAPASPRYGQGLYVIRPDGYVGFRTTDGEAARAWCEKVLHGGARG